MGRRETVVLGGLVSVLLLASVLVSPSGAVSLAERTTHDPLLFGAVVCGLYLVRPFVLWPATLLAVVVGYGFGLRGIPVALAGAVVTSVVPFYAARWLGSESPRIARLQTTGERLFETTGGVRGVAACRLAPIPSDGVTCAAAIAGVPFYTFATGVLIGELPWTIAAVLVGDSVATLTASELDAIDPRVGLVTAIAAALLLVGPAYRKLRGGRSGSVD
jgi:uncharacterized membrane protein YdjX (TVP38/TMEM64 family)